MKLYTLEKIIKVDTDLGPIYYDDSKSDDKIYSFDKKTWFNTKEYNKKMVAHSRKPSKRCPKHDWGKGHNMGRTARKGKYVQTFDMTCKKCGKTQMFNNDTGKQMCKR